MLFKAADFNLFIPIYLFVTFKTNLLKTILIFDALVYVNLIMEKLKNKNYLFV